MRQAKLKFKHEQKRKIKRKKIKLSKLPQVRKNNKNKKFINDPNKKEHYGLEAPKVFSLINDPASALIYFEKIANKLKNGESVFLDLSNVLEMGPDTLTYLCALVKDDKYTNGTALSGNTPIEPKLNQMFRKSGFLKLIDPRFNSSTDTDVYSQLLHRVTRLKVHTELASKVCKTANMHTFGSEDHKVKQLYPILIECMQNTWEHANVEKDIKTRNWWLLAYKEPDTKITKFCFLDLGIGIISSLKNKYNANKLVGRLLNAFTLDNDAITLQKIFEGERKTSTSKSERGLGLQTIYKLVRENDSIKNFILLTNNVTARIEYNNDVIVQKINKNFNGTLYYWELIPQL